MFHSTLKCKYLLVKCLEEEATQGRKLDRVPAAQSKCVSKIPDDSQMWPMCRLCSDFLITLVDLSWTSFRMIHPLSHDSELDDFNPFFTLSECLAAPYDLNVFQMSTASRSSHSVSSSRSCSALRAALFCLNSQTFSCQQKPSAEPHVPSDTSLFLLFVVQQSLI